MSGQYIERWLTEFTTFKIPRDRTVMKPKTEDGRIWSVITELIKESIEVRTNNGYMGRVVESDSDVLLVTVWRSQQELDDVHMSPEYQDLVKRLNTFSHTPATSYQAILDNYLAWGTGPTSVIDVHFPASWSEVAKDEFYRNCRGFRHAIIDSLLGPGKRLFNKSYKGWINGKFEWKGQPSIIMRFLVSWLSEEHEKQFKATDQGYQKWTSECTEAGMLGICEYHMLWYPSATGTIDMADISDDEEEYHEDEEESKEDHELEKRTEDLRI